MNYAIVLSAGKSQRFDDAKNEKISDKLLLHVNGKPIIYYTFVSLNDHPDIHEILVVANKKNISAIKKTIKLYGFSKIKKVILGADTRQNSMIKGFEELSKKAKKSDIILIQNGANPLPSFKEISETIKKVKTSGAAITGHKVTSTIKEINATHVIKTHDRNKFFAAQTPQAATYEILRKAIINAQKKKLNVTDEAMMFEAIGQKTAYVHAHEHNFKITNHADYMKLKSILGEKPDDFIVGIGQDSHEFEPATSHKSTSQKTLHCLILGGIKIPEEPKLKANSDGDVILHALFNAISQALGEKSLGFYADEKAQKGIKNSKKYMEIILKKAHKQGYKLNNVGLMLECAHPKIDPISHEIKKSLSDLLSLPPAKIGITATSGENLTAFGKGQAIQCYAIVSLVK
ncbi:MAG: 2-C-methyl-D-erythritol 2,4-cyclodiphosphate synthase [Candidatus Gracilibacteria bacterium]|jgi:2-C-methyl-D-erythritol 4-phosphate cytidylyltransferase/2-C-methyl-D-erythritol 2,4-cyclodiphosphate synthase